jgi:acyl-CoA synthetase (AMP-forming)/AMP-acid ligase II
VPSAERYLDPGYLTGWLAESRVTVAHLTPSLGQLICDGAPAGGLPALRWAFFGGEAVQGRHLAALRRAAPQVSAFSFYGATETPQVMAEQPCDDGMSGPMPLGRGIDGVQLLVLTPDDRLAGVGEIGEIAVRTPYLSTGYLDDPLQTARRFIANPFTGQADDRIYRTGDLGRYLPDGLVTYAGRRDRQVKLRGFRVELAEIEQALLDLDGVTQAVVQPWPSPTGGVDLVAYVVPEAVGDPADVRARLAARLPAYMLPAGIIGLTALPLTANGKIDLAALPRTDGAVAAGYVAPRHVIEEVLAGVWADLLQREAVGVSDDFFALGGHSLLAGRIAVRVEADLGLRLPLRLFFEEPTVAHQAAWVLREHEALLADVLARLDGDSG